MEFSHRGMAQAPQSTGHMGGVATGEAHRGRKSDADKNKLFRIAAFVLLVATTILVIAILFLLYFGNSNESQFINKDKFQAVDMNVGGSNSSDQIYFGKITKLNDKYMVLENIYYIVPSQQGSTSTSNYTLVKLGCELHAPYDQMVINRDHVVFWENLQSSGTVAQKIAQYQQQNPKGPNCSQSSNSTSSTSSNATSTQSSTTAPTSTTPVTPTTPAKKP